MSLHWAIAALLVFNFGLGKRTEHLENGPELFAVFQLHKSIGITILILSLWRLWVRLRRPRPSPIGPAGWTQKLAEAVHWGFYVIMISVPVTGWIIVSTAKIKIPTLLFGLIPWPHLPLGGVGKALHEIAEEGHGLMSNLMLLLILLHVAGAARHQFFERHALLERMMPVLRAGFGRFGLALALLVASFAMGRALPLGAKAKPDPAVTSSPSAVVLADVATQAEAAIEPEKAAEAERAVETDLPVLDQKVPAAANSAIVAPEPSTATIGPIPSWTISPGGKLAFSVTVNGEEVQGRFGRWTGDIRFDPARLDQSRINVSIDLASVSSGDDQRDSMLAGDDFFATAANPRAQFKSDRIISKGGNRYEARGPLTIRGQSQPVALDFTLDIKGNNANVAGKARIERLKFGIGSGQFEGDETISKSVGVDFSFAATRPK
jgi:cytochrome b561/polyisoprenoid-binding protein YceI